MIKASIALVPVPSIWRRCQGALQDPGNSPWEGANVVAHGAIMRQNGRAFLQIIPEQAKNTHWDLHSLEIAIRKKISPVTDRDSGGLDISSHRYGYWGHNLVFQEQQESGCCSVGQLTNTSTWNHLHQAPHQHVPITGLDAQFDTKGLPFIPFTWAPTHSLFL